MTVAKILDDKGTFVPTIGPEKLVGDVIGLLEEQDVGALVVTAENDVIDGIISERDVVRGLQLFGPAVLGHAVCDLMTKNVHSCSPGETVANVMAMMDRERIRHVPVIADGKLAGFISIRDIIKLRLDEVQAEADAMRTYIAGAA